MCGIFAVVNDNKAADTLLMGLKALEYRGYDSAGIALVDQKEIYCRKAKGKLVNLEQELIRRPAPGQTGIAHTRWATHGKANKTNAHPHVVEKVAVVHNGIVENADELRRELEVMGLHFDSETDSEIIPKFINYYLNEGYKPLIATRKSLEKIEGAYAIAVLFLDKKDQLIAARRGSPLVIGFNHQSAFIASDTLSGSLMADELVYLEDGDLALVEANDLHVFDKNMTIVKRPRSQVKQDKTVVNKEGFNHFMLKEIHEQPVAVQQSLFAISQLSIDTVPEMDFSLIGKLDIVACGSSFYAGMVAKYWFERYAGLDVAVELASEFRYRQPHLTKGGACLFISQSGETADTLAAMKYAKDRHQHALSLVNVVNSSISRESDYSYYTLAGPEIGVASTKAFTSQLVVLAHLVCKASRQRRFLDNQQSAVIENALHETAAALVIGLRQEKAIQAVASHLRDVTNCLFLGRGQCFPIALEGALKLKEISYIHAEGYAAGELKHGPIALIEAGMPVIVLAPYDDVFNKTISNVQEVRARGAKIILITDTLGKAAAKGLYDHFIELPCVDEFVQPVVYTLAVQLLAYYTALCKKTDVDQPRNLAKSVTVE